MAADRDELIDNLSLALMYLTSWEEGEGDWAYRRFWKGYDWGCTDRLKEAGLISGANRNKSYAMTDEGEATAQAIVAALEAVSFPDLPSSRPHS